MILRQTDHFRRREQLPFELFMITVWVIQVAVGARRTGADNIAFV